LDIEADGRQREDSHLQTKESGVEQILSYGLQKKKKKERKKKKTLVS